MKINEQKIVVFKTFCKLCICVLCVWSVSCKMPGSFSTLKFQFCCRVCCPFWMRLLFCEFPVEGAWTPLKVLKEQNVSTSSHFAFCYYRWSLVKWLLLEWYGDVHKEEERDDLVPEIRKVGCSICPREMRWWIAIFVTAAAAVKIRIDERAFV